MNRISDPRILLRRAVLLMRVWAAVFLGLGAVAVLPLSLALLVGRTRFVAGHMLYYGVCAIVFVAPAALYLWFAVHVRCRRQWAIVAAISAAAIHGLCAICGLIGLIFLMRVSGGAFIIAPAAGAVLFASASAHLILTLSRSLGAIHLSDDDVQGFPIK
jgi:hypothetical protein